MKIAREVIRPYWLTGAIILLAVFFVISSLRFYQHVPIASWGDTVTYHSMSRASLTDPALWTGRYPMTTGLFHKICSAQPGFIADLQVGLAMFSWIMLGLAVVIIVQIRMLKLVAFAIIMGLGLTTSIISMNKILLSENYSNSLFVLMTSIMILLAK